MISDVFSQGKGPRPAWGDLLALLAFCWGLSCGRHLQPPGRVQRDLLAVPLASLFFSLVVARALSACHDLRCWHGHENWLMRWISAVGPSSWTRAITTIARHWRDTAPWILEVFETDKITAE